MTERPTPGTVTIFGEAARTNEGGYKHGGTLHNGIGIHCEVISQKPLEAGRVLRTDELLQVPEGLCSIPTYRVKAGHETVNAYDAGTLTL